MNSPCLCFLSKIDSLFVFRCASHQNTRFATFFFKDESIQCEPRVKNKEGKKVKGKDWQRVAKLHESNSTGNCWLKMKKRALTAILFIFGG